jgi:hypothetical protein
VIKGRSREEEEDDDDDPRGFELGKRRVYQPEPTKVKIWRPK